MHRPVCVCVHAHTKLHIHTHKRTYALSYGMQLEVEESSDGAQLVRLGTDLPGKLVLHWGVEGGKSAHKAGWVLPPDHCRPEGTVQYKKRALQTPWK